MYNYVAWSIVQIVTTVKVMFTDSLATHSRSTTAHPRFQNWNIILHSLNE